MDLLFDCMYGWMFGLMDECVNRWVYVWMDLHELMCLLTVGFIMWLCMYDLMDGCVYQGVCVCMNRFICMTGCMNWLMCMHVLKQRIKMYPLMYTKF